MRKSCWAIRARGWRRAGADPALAVTRSSDGATPVARAKVIDTCAELHKVVPTRLAPHLLPERTKVYQLLQQALERTNKAGLALFSMRGKEYLTAVKAENGVLSAHTMHFADEVRDPRREVDNLPDQDLAVSDRELGAAEQLIGILAMDWDPEQWHDTYGEQVRELVQAKADGREIAVSDGPAEASNVVDLMDILTRSLESASQGSDTPAGRDDDSGSTHAARPKPTSGRASRAPATAHRAPKAPGGKKSTSSRQPAKPAATGKKRAAAKKHAGLATLTKAELYRMATEQDIPHRSTMTRDQLQNAIEHNAPSKRRHLRSA